MIFQQSSLLFFTCVAVYSKNIKKIKTFVWNFIRLLLSFQFIAFGKITNFKQYQQKNYTAKPWTVSLLNIQVSTNISEYRTFVRTFGMFVHKIFNFYTLHLKSNCLWFVCVWKSIFRSYIYVKLNLSI